MRKGDCFNNKYFASKGALLILPLLILFCTFMMPGKVMADEGMGDRARINGNLSWALFPVN